MRGTLVYDTFFPLSNVHHLILPFQDDADRQALCVWLSLGASLSKTWLGDET